MSLNGLSTAEAKKQTTEWLASKGLGRAAIQFKLRDWLFSRQRYWGEPFPILHGPDGEVVALDESELPVELPEMEDFKPVASDDPTAPPQPPLGRAPESWRVIERNGVRYTRELNTMPQWAGSCWYYLRFLDPHNADQPVGREAEAYWMGTKRNRLRLAVLISMSVAPSTRCCICCTRGSGTRCCTTSGMSAHRSRSVVFSIRVTFKPTPIPMSAASMCCR